MSRPNRAPELEIRLASPGYESAISAVLLEAFSRFREHYTSEAFAEVTPGPERLSKRFDEGPQWVAVLNGEIVGTASAVQQEAQLYIRSVGVARHAQGHGIATRLMKTIEEYARTEGIERLFLYTTYFSTGAVQMYEKLGFVRGRDTTAEEWFGTPGLEMWKELN